MAAGFMFLMWAPVSVGRFVVGGGQYYHMVVALLWMVVLRISVLHCSCISYLILLQTTSKSFTHQDF